MKVSNIIMNKNFNPSNKKTATNNQWAKGKIVGNSADYKEKTTTNNQ